MTAELKALVTSWHRFDLSLRMNEGFDDAAFLALKSALEMCAAAWSGQQSVPKIGANVLVDIFPATESNAELYPDEIKQRVMDSAFELQDLVGACLAIDEAELNTLMEE